MFSDNDNLKNCVKPTSEGFNPFGMSDVWRNYIHDLCEQVTGHGKLYQNMIYEKIVSDAETDNPRIGIDTETGGFLSYFDYPFLDDK